MNIARGALAMLRVESTPEAKRDKWRQEQLANQQLHRAISLAKSKLSPSDVNDIENWILRQLYETNRVAGRLGTGVVSLGLFPIQFHSKALHVELELVNGRLSDNIKALGRIASYASAIEQAFLSSDWSRAKSILQRLSETDGYSYWYVELAIAIAQAESGLEEMKKTVASLSPGTTGAQKFLLHFFGVRNETAQTASRFRETAARRISETELPEGLKTYFKFRLYHELSLNEASVAYVLSAEQLTTDIDLLFTAISICQWISSNRNAFSARSIEACNKLITTLRPLTSTLNLSLATESLFDGAQTDTSSDLHELARKSIRQLWSPAANLIHYPDNALRIIDGIVARMTTRSDGVAAEDLSKLSLNFPSLPILMKLGRTDEVPPFPLLFLRAIGRPVDSLPAAPLYGALIWTIERWVEGGADDMNVSNVLSLLRSISAANEGSEVSAAGLLTQTDPNDLEQDCYFVVASIIQEQTGHASDAVRAAATAGIRNAALVPLLPLVNLFQGVRWNSLVHLADSIDLAICLELYLRLTGDSKARSYKRFAVEELLKKFSCQSLPDLQDALLRAGNSVAHVQFFFQSVCDIYTIELLPGVGQSRRAHEIRIDVLRKLTELPGVPPGDFLDEANNIEAQLDVSEGLVTLDESRVYVDEATVLTSGSRELSADFKRYKNLVASGIGARESFAELLKSVKHPKAKDFQLPTNDADALFGEIVFRLREKFLNDSPAGLDIHIGRRIRHGTIASHFRGPLEALSLIGQRPHRGAVYEPPDAAVTAAASLDPKSKARVFAAFARFSDSIDQLIGLLRDEYFHVQSRTKARGVFDVPLTPMYLAFARGVAQSCESIDEFSRHCVAMFWVQLAAHLEKTRPVAAGEAKRAINSAFERLFQELRAAGLRDTALISSVQHGLEELRKRIPLMADWMRVPKTTMEGKVFGMPRIVDVAVALVKGQRPSFRPKINALAPSTLALDTYGLSIVVDALYIALDNVFMHSGKRIDNNIDITVGFDEVRSIVTFLVRNELGKDGWSAEKEAKLEKIKADIVKRAHKESARRDFNSGLSKLATIVLQSDETTIDFGYEGKTHFWLKFSLHFVARPVVVAHDSVEQFLSDVAIAEGK